MTYRAIALKTLKSGYFQKMTGRRVHYAHVDEIVRIKEKDGNCALCWFENGKIGWVSVKDIKMLDNE